MPAVTEITPEIEKDIEESIDKVMHTRDMRKQLAYILVSKSQNILLARQRSDLERHGMARERYDLTQDEAKQLNRDMNFRRSPDTIRAQLRQAFYDNARLVLQVNALRQQKNLPTLKTFTSASFRNG